MRISLVFLFVLACGASAEDDISEVPTSRTEFNVPGSLVRPTLDAADLWRSSGYDVPDVVIGAQSATWRMVLRQGIIANCDEGPALGCTERPMFSGDFTLIEISTEVPDEQQVSVIAHEIGHALGFEHGAGDVMDTERDLSGPVCTPAGDCVGQN